MINEQINFIINELDLGDSFTVFYVGVVLS